MILSLSVLALLIVDHTASYATEVLVEPVQACVIPRDMTMSNAMSVEFARCLGWESGSVSSMCGGGYRPITVEPLVSPDEIRVQADKVSFYNQGRSTLSGNVQVQQTNRVVNAQTAYVYRDAKTNQVTHIELLGAVTYLEPERLMVARKVTINTQDKSGKAEDVLYRFDSRRQSAILPAWGRAGLIERFANKDYLLEKATYSTCSPQDYAWHIAAEKITLNDADKTGVARDAKLVIGKVPVFYTPYLSFPTSKERKSGFLLPTKGYSNIGGFNFSLPYYWNIAPDYDATITPSIYTLRGVMLGGQFRYLTENSAGQINGHFLPDDHAYKKFLHQNEWLYPQLRDSSTDRWSVQFNDITQINPDLRLRINLHQVSDDYYQEDFSSNLAILTERQLEREGDLTYTTDNWVFKGMVQSYQTLQPIDQTPVNDVYQRLPQLMAYGSYSDLPLNANFNVLGQLDNFKWPNSIQTMPEGPRYFLNPQLSLPYLKPWGFFTPGMELVQNYYDIHNDNLIENHYDRTIPRYSFDSGLYFDRSTTSWFNQPLTQTLEPRVYYLYVPYHDQTQIPVYDSAYMIFNTDQLFRTNRFSGFDRIGDTNQLSYAVTTRWLSDNTGAERASFTVGQIRYFDQRRVQLCQSYLGYCYDSPLTLGYLSPLAKSSPIASRAVYHFNSTWAVTGDYVWDTYAHDTNNAHVDFHYQPAPDANKILSFGYTYLVNGDITQVAYSNIQNNPLHQATFSYAWPFTEKWSSLGAFSYNISKRYEMISFFGLQYDNCCWAARLVGGRTFQSLSPQLRPQYNNNVYLQVLLKGLGTLGYSNPSSVIRTYIPGYRDNFHN
ncbi:LPS-assembly protein LptD [Legionella dresdenensis]|uniref:LPS-assembly protein LptD n=1 Tax=Legionella dresdenensis TaxID=450200 RepID=A0ABV8CGK2_9GAMM